MAEVRRAGIFKALVSRGIKVDAESREWILSCTDADLLEIWFDRSFNVAKASGLFKD